MNKQKVYNTTELREVDISPQLAEEMLTRNGHNRPMSERRAQRLAERIKRGEWRYNGESIIVDWHDNILDGQHRLWAIFLSGKTVKSAIVYGIDPATFTTIDVGRGRSSADSLAVFGYQNTSSLSVAARIIYNLELNAEQYQDAYGVSNEAIIDIVERHPGLIESTAKCLSWGSRTGLGRGRTAGLHYLFSQVNQEQADTFVADFANGTGVVAENDAFIRLRDRLRDARMSATVNIDVATQLALVIKAWNMYRTGKVLRHVAWKRTGEKPEPFPKPV